MKVGIVRYPGSNCDYDALRYFENSFFIWHKETVLPDLDLLVIPGGFAFGDRVYQKATGKYKIEPAVKAIESPVTKVILEAYKKKIPILGICNGFQILIKLGLLEGNLLRNSDNKFHSYLQDCYINGKNFKIPIANNFGLYKGDIDKSRILITYDNNEIGGVCNKERTVFGMMPHPERLPDDTNLKKELFNLLFQSVDKSMIKTIMESEHVSYKSTKKFLSKLYTEGKHVIQGPGENAGIIDIGEGYALCLRIESHNHPIFINPFQGAATGVGGILRDIFTMGARPIALFDFLRFGEDKKSEFIEEKTIEGISYYGNCVGVPILGGDYYKDKVFDKNPLLNVGCIGIVKKENIIYGNALNKDSLIIYIGSKTGKEGIGGADMASKEFKEDGDNLEDNIQTGDPFLEKLLLEVCCRLAELKILEGMQDMGAGGLLCSSLEMIIRGRNKTNKNLGCLLDIEKVPTKEYMTPTEILISESQERMLLVCDIANSQKIKEICETWDLEYCQIGKVTEDGNYTVQRYSNIIYNVKIEDFVSIKEDWKVEKSQLYHPLEKPVYSLNKWSVYDNTLGGRTIKGPLEKANYSIIRLFEINKDLYVTWGKDVEECRSNLKDFKLEKLTIINCMNFGHPKHAIKSFEETINKLKDDCLKYDIPVVGGNVSLYNCTDNISIPPNPVLMMVGISL